MSNEKDITEKLLFDKNDVFADIFNVLLFGGKELVRPQKLAATGQKSQLKIDGKIHEQERDVSKLWMDGKVRLALLGLENQTKAEKDMPMRIISYDGSGYKEQVIHNKNREKDVEKWDPYPVISIVLYFGKHHWTGPRSLKELLGPLPPEVEPYVNDYKLHVFEISFLSPETVAMFKSDFRIVADFFVQTRTNKDYHPSKETIVHVEETLKLLSVLTGDDRFERDVNEVMMKGGPITMCDVLDQAETRGVQKGRAEGRIEGEKNALKRAICAVADVFSVKELAKRFELSEENVESILQEAKIATQN